MPGMVVSMPHNYWLSLWHQHQTLISINELVSNCNYRLKLIYFSPLQRSNTVIRQLNGVQYVGDIFNCNFSTEFPDRAQRGFMLKDFILYKFKFHSSLIQVNPLTVITGTRNNLRWRNNKSFGINLFCCRCCRIYGLNEGSRHVQIKKNDLFSHSFVDLYDWCLYIVEIMLLNLESWIFSWTNIDA